MANSQGRILIVDDEERIRRLLKLIWKEDGYETAEAEDGMTAVEMILSKLITIWYCWISCFRK